jgi:hypothetical protein
MAAFNSATSLSPNRHQMPRATSISSTMRSLSRKRKYSQTEWLMISGGNRQPMSGEGTEVVVPLITAPDPPSQADRC